MKGIEKLHGFKRISFATISQADSVALNLERSLTVEIREPLHTFSRTYHLNAFQLLKQGGNKRGRFSVLQSKN